MLLYFKDHFDYFLAYNLIVMHVCWKMVVDFEEKNIEFSVVGQIILSIQNIFDIASLLI